MSAKKQLEWSIQASDDLADIYDGIVDDNPKAAAQVIRIVTVLHQSKLYP